MGLAASLGFPGTAGPLPVPLPVTHRARGSRSAPSSGKTRRERDKPEEFGVWETRFH